MDVLHYQRAFELAFIYFVALLLGLGPCSVAAAAVIIYNITLPHSERSKRFRWWTTLGIPVIGPPLALYNWYADLKDSYCRERGLDPDYVSWKTVTADLSCRTPEMDFCRNEIKNK